MSRTTCIRNAAWVAAWDQGADRHVYDQDVDVAFTDDRIVHVGAGYTGAVDVRIDGAGLFIMPGLIDLHSHPSTEPSYKGIREEHGVSAMYMTGLYERLHAFRLDEDGQRAAAEISYADLLQSGVTTIADLTGPFDGWVELLAQSGLRGFVAPGYASARWSLENDHELKYIWDEAAGRRGLDQALKVIEAAEADPSGRLAGMIFPAQIDTCSEELLRDSMALAQETGRPFTTHAAQSVVEFNEMVRRHGMTPVQWAGEIGVLGPQCVLGHGMFIDSHSSMRWHTDTDLDLLAGTGTSVAHCPTPFARYGDKLEDFGRYVRAGVNMGIGTDTAPHNLIEEMRWALVLAHIAAKDIHTAHTADVFHAATVGGAKALLRDDLGRLAPGMKADLVVVDCTEPAMMPVRDPLKSLIYHAADRAVRDVYIDGRQVVGDGRVLTLDPAAAAGHLAEAQQRMCAAVPEFDYDGRTAQEIAPLSLDLR